MAGKESKREAGHQAVVDMCCAPEACPPDCPLTGWPIAAPGDALSGFWVL